MKILPPGAACFCLSLCSTDPSNSLSLDPISTILLVLFYTPSFSGALLSVFKGSSSWTQDPSEGVVFHRQLPF